MHDLAIQFRTAQFIAHEYHNTVKGPTFFSDHAFLGELYETYTEAYDDLVEEIIGLGMEVYPADLTEIAASKAVSSEKPDSTIMFRNLLLRERQICKMISDMLEGDEGLNVESLTEGTENLLQDLAMRSNKRQYKLRQRIG